MDNLSLRMIRSRRLNLLETRTDSIGFAIENDLLTSKGAGGVKADNMYYVNLLRTVSHNRKLKAHASFRLRSQKKCA